MAKKPNFEPFTVEHFQTWARGLKLDNGEPWKVEEHFLAYVADVFAAYGKQELTRCWLVVPEGNGKTTNLAGLALYHCEHLANAFVPWAASARDQAEIGYAQAKVFVDSMPAAKRPRCFDGYRRIKYPNGSRVQVFAAGSEHADGVIPTMPIIDELHRHKNLSLYRTWTGKLKKRQAQMLVISTAGEPGSEFEDTREKIKKEATEKHEVGAFGRYATARVVLHEWAVRDGKTTDMLAVKAANPASWIDSKYLGEKLADPDMTDAHWKRFTCNIATRLEAEVFIDEVNWNDCLNDTVEIPKGAYVCIGADGSRSWDTTVIAWATALDDHIDVDCRVFSVRPDVAHHVLHEGAKIDFNDVEGFLLDLFDKFHPLESAYDPRYLERSMEIVDVRLPDKSVIAVEPSSKNARDAYQALFTAVLEGKLRHKGDPVLAAHLSNCGVERDMLTREIRRLRQLDPRKPIDAVPALALAVWRAMEAQPSVYEERGVIAI